MWYAILRHAEVSRKSEQREKFAANDVFQAILSDRLFVYLNDKSDRH